VTSYNTLKEEITKLIDYPIKWWCIERPSAEKCLAQLDEYEAEGRPAPKMFVEDEGVTLTWLVGEWKIYQHFISDGSGSEFYCFWIKMVDTQSESV
jgi:hypothetical protein